MSGEDLARVSVKILDKEYQVACPPEEQAALKESAEYLHRKMREIRDALDAGQFAQFRAQFKADRARGV